MCNSGNVTLSLDFPQREWYYNVKPWLSPNAYICSILAIVAVVISRTKMANMGKSSDDTSEKRRGRKLSQIISTVLFCAVLYEWTTKILVYFDSESFGTTAVFENLLTTFLMVLALSVEDHGKRFHRCLRIFWTVVLIRFLCVTYAQYKNVYYKEPVHLEEWCLRLLYILAIVLKILDDLCELDTTQLGEEPKTPVKEKPSFLSRITFSWLDSMFLQGYKTTLKNDDLPELKSGNKAENAFAKFYPNWQKEFSKHKRDQETTEENDTSTHGASHDQGLFKAVLSTFRYGILITITLGCIKENVLFIQPLILKYLIQFVEDKSQGMWIGIMFTASLFILSQFRSILEHNLGQYKHEMEFKMKTSLLATIYSKMLKMSNAARKSSTTGEIVNLMSVDAGKVCEMIHWIHHIGTCPLKVLICIYLLWAEVGVSAIAGFISTFLFAPAHGYISKRVRHWHLKVSDLKDERIKLMNEVLNGIKVLKLYAWEKSFEKKILDIREKEISLLRKIVIFDAISIFLWNIGPFLVSFSTFGLYVMMDDNNTLDAEKAFVSMAIFNILSWNMSIVPMVFNMYIMAMVSMKRLNRFLNNEELDEDIIERSNNSAYAVSVDDATFSWNRTDKAVLKNINLDIPEGSLVAIVGTVGAGKSSLLSAILGEMEKLSGIVNVKGTIAYVSQLAWMQNATLRDNVLFGKPLDKDKYRKIIEDCALRDDLDILPGRDKAEIGEKGINLSGGQKQRVNMARAVYQNADIYLFDDPLSAVDSHVGKHIFNNIIGPDGSLKHKTRILVTHGISFLPRVDTIVTLKDGMVSEVGTYEELKMKSGAFAEFLKTYEKEDRSSDEEGEGDGKMHESKRFDARTVFASQMSIKEEEPENLGQEEVYTGKVKFSHFTSYISNVGYTLCVIILLAFIVDRAADIFTKFWLSEWTNDSTNNINPLSVNNSINNRNTHDQKYYRVGIYGTVGIFQALMALVEALLIFLGGLSASRNFHNSLLRNILSSPMSFFDTNPVGRIVTRFSKDIHAIDWAIVFLRNYCECVSIMITIPLVVGCTLPWFLMTIFPVVIIYLTIQKFYNPTMRQLKRLESANKSPIYSHFSESICGASTIRAYKQQSRFETESRRKTDCYHKSILTMFAAIRWVGVRVDFLASVLTVFACLFAIMSRDIFTAGIVAMCITYTMDTTHTLHWWMRVSINLTERLISVERVNEFIEKPTEASWEIEETKPSENWPTKGNVSFKDYQVRYREGLDLVLKGITCNIHSGEKIGIVGRTGAGKSSLTMALFRIIESVRGSIIIDDVDISTIGLHDLRSKLTIIPQDPVLFSGSLRMNLDPFDHYSDKEVWKALNLAHLGQFVRTLPDQLQYQCNEGGENLSVGQRQLICLARALLKKTKVLVLDEATAAVDMETDDLIQKTIRAEFSDCTILTIAHRLNTIMDYDRIMVLSRGRILEFDKPNTLLSKTDSAFYNMAKDADIV